jgi:hypothetical protein
MNSKEKEESEARVRAWGFNRVFTWQDAPFVSLAPNPVEMLYLFLHSEISAEEDLTLLKERNQTNAWLMLDP